MRISVDGSRIRNNKVAFSNLSGIVWTGPQSFSVKDVYFKTRQWTTAEVRMVLFK